jgi:hypothetical protein
MDGITLNYKKEKVVIDNTGDNFWITVYGGKDKKESISSYGVPPEQAKAIAGRIAMQLYRPVSISNDIKVFLKAILKEQLKMDLWETGNNKEYDHKKAMNGPDIDLLSITADFLGIPEDGYDNNGHGYCRDWMMDSWFDLGVDIDAYIDVLINESRKINNQPPITGGADENDQ